MKTWNYNKAYTYRIFAEHGIPRDCWQALNEIVQKDVYEWKCGGHDVDLAEVIVHTLRQSAWIDECAVCGGERRVHGCTDSECKFA